MSDLADKLFAAIEADEHRTRERQVFFDAPVEESWHTLRCGANWGSQDVPCSCPVPASVLRRCAADRELLDLIFAYEAKTDGEWGCCHSAEEIRAGACPETTVASIPAVRALARGYGLEVDGA